MRRYLYLLFFASLIAFACAKSGGVTEDPGNGGGGPHVYNPEDSTYPVITILNPADSQVYTSGNIISIDAKITDNGLFQGGVKITNDANGAIVKQQLYETHGLQSFTFNVTYPTAVTAVTYYTITVFYQDHGLNSSSKSIKVKVNP